MTITFNNIVKTFSKSTEKEVSALQDVSFSVNDNEFVSIVGPSGCGKTTLLKILANLETQDSGTITYSNDQVPESRLIFQDQGLLPWLTVLENIGLGRYFDFILPSAVVGSAKPDKKIFEEALRLSGVAPHEACHIGDEIRTDVEGAQSVGIHPILLDRNNRFDSTETRKITTFLELVEKPG